MNDICALRLYFPLKARASATRFWHRLSAPALAHHLMTAAHRAGINQVVLLHVQAGYLAGNKLSQHHADVTSMAHPQCLELLDNEHRLRKFLHEHAAELHKVRAVLFRCELPLHVPPGGTKS